MLGHFDYGRAVALGLLRDGDATHVMSGESGDHDQSQTGNVFSDG